GAGDSLTVIDVLAGKEAREIPLGRYGDPHGLQVGPDGRSLFVTCEASRAVVEVDVATGAIRRAIDTGREATHMLVVTPDGKKLYAADIRGGSCTAIDLGRGLAVAQVATGAGCEGIDATPDGSRVWTANKEAGTLTVIDTARDEAIASLPCDGRP